VQYSCCVKLWPGVRVLFHNVNVIIRIAAPPLEDMVFDTYSSAVGEKHTTAARRDRLAFLVRRAMVT